MNFDAPIHAQSFRVADPSDEPVSVAELKSHVRQDSDEDDTLIASFISAARQAYEDYTSRALITQTWRQVFDAAPCGREIVLLRGPVSAVTAIKYRDADGAEQTFSSANYTADVAGRLPARVWLNADADWPDCGEFPSAFWVEFTAGYGSSATNCPARARLAVTLLASHLYENRLPLNIGNIVNELPFSLRHLMDQDRLFLI